MDIHAWTSPVSLFIIVLTWLLLPPDLAFFYSTENKLPLWVFQFPVIVVVCCRQPPCRSSPLTYSEIPESLLSLFLSNLWRQNPKYNHTGFLPLPKWDSSCSKIQLPNLCEVGYSQVSGHLLSPWSPLLLPKYGSLVFSVFSIGLFRIFENEKFIFDSQDMSWYCLVWLDSRTCLFTLSTHFPTTSKESLVTINCWSRNLFSENGSRTLCLKYQTGIGYTKSSFSRPLWTDLCHGLERWG